MFRCSYCWWMMVFWVVPQWVAAQGALYERCGTEARVLAAQTEFPELVQQSKALQERLQAAPEAKSQAILRIPVVVHVLYHTPAENISDQRIYEQLQVLNEDFRRQNSDANQTPASFLPVAADTEIEFCLVTRDPNNQPTSGITRTAVATANIGNTSDYYKASAGGVDAWNTNRYLNIWVCAIGNGTLGFAYPPGTAPVGADGVVIDPKNFGLSGVALPYNGGRTTTHEVGHWLNLEHIWGPGNGGCGVDDGINDTPLQDRGSSGCRAHPSASCNTEDMFMNYMDYTNDACMNLFTAGQKARMRTALQNARPNLLTNTGACVQVQNDGGARILSPTLAVCTDSVRAEIEVVNYGTNALQSATVYFQLNQQPIRALSWTGNLGSGQRSALTLPALRVDGLLVFQQLRVWTSQPNGTADGMGNNDTASTQFQAVVPVSYPFFEGFEQVGMPSGWTVTNPDNQITWARTTDAAKGGNASFYLNNWDYANQLGAVDGLESPPIQFGNTQQPTLTFDLAYALYSASGYSDTLRVYASVDCGQTWNLVYDKAGQNLTTVASTRSTAFFPTDSEWRNESIDLSAYAGQSTLKLRFTHISEAENNLFLDNIRLAPYVGVHRRSLPTLPVQLAPNPTAEVAQLTVQLPRATNLRIRVFNVLGQPILDHQERAEGRVVYQLDARQWAPGGYLVQVQGEDRQWTGKLWVK